MTKKDKAEKKMMEAVAKHIRFKIPTKSAVIKGQKIEYFQGEPCVCVCGALVCVCVCARVRMCV